MRKKKLCDKLAELMESRGITIDGLVRESRVLKSRTVLSWVRGDRVPSARGIVDLASALKMTPTDLLSGVDVPMRVTVDIEAITGGAL